MHRSPLDAQIRVREAFVERARSGHFGSSQGHFLLGPFFARSGNAGFLGFLLFFFAFS